MVRGNLGVCESVLGDDVAAHAHLRDAVPGLDAVGADFPAAYFAAHLAMVAARRGEVAQAQEARERAAAGLGDNHVARGLIHVVDGFLARARGVDALRSLRAAETIHASLADRRLGTAFSGVLPSELASAIGQLRRALGDDAAVVS